MDEERKRIVFFSRGDDAFIGDIIEELSKKYETKKITIRIQEEMKLIDQWMEWADICWFEWCDGLIIHGSKLAIAKEKKIICRLHSYEAFTAYPSQVNWSCVDQLIFIAEHIQKFVTENYKIHKKSTIIIPNGVDMGKWTYKERNPGFKVAYVGYINYKKGPMLLLQTFKAIYDADNRYQFHVAGRFQDQRDSLYFQQMVEELGLKNNYFFHGWQDDLDQWLEDKNYILCTSVLESQNMSVMQAMAKGIKPVIHNFVGAKEIYKKEHVWNTIKEAVDMITDTKYNSGEYRDYINERYTLERQYKTVDGMMDALTLKEKKQESFNYKAYWSQRLNSKFNIEGVGYWGLGEIYNQFLYRNRIELLEEVTNKAFDTISNKKVLELGPGTGIFTEFFYNKGVVAYDAVDIVEKSVSELGRRFSQYNFRQGDICDSSTYEDIYDLIFAADVLLHITDKDNYEKTIDNISKHLNENGFCILLDPISVINTKSQSAHVVIRDSKYVEETLEKYGLKLIEMLPVAYFMNFPFDSKAIGPAGSYAVALFSFISQIFSANSLGSELKQNIGEYLCYKEKQLLYYRNTGLSEKLLIIRKKGKEGEIGFSMQSLLNIESINERLRAVNEKLDQDYPEQRHLLLKINELLIHLEQYDNLSCPSVHNAESEAIQAEEEEG